MPSIHPEVLQTTLTRRSRLTLSILFLLIVLGVCLRLFFLNADPSYPEWIGYITDEGRWSGVARDLALFGQHELTELSTLHIAIAPLYQVFVWISFEAFGVDFWSARLFSAVCGSILLGLCVRFLWRIGVTLPALFFGVVILALQPDLVFLSRVAIPEMAATLVHFCAFLMLLRDKPTIRSTIIASLITVFGLAMKATTMPIIFVFVAIVAFCTTGGRKQRIWHVLGFILGVAVPGVLALGVIVWSGGTRAFTDVVTILNRFADISSVSGSVWFWFMNRFVQPVILLLLVAWCVGILLFLKSVRYDSRLGRVYVASAIWVLGWITFATLMTYFPSRYFFLILVPLTIHLCAGLSLLSIELEEKPPELSIATQNWIAAVAVSLPIAILLTPLLVNLVGELFPDAYHLRGRLTLIFATATILSIIGKYLPLTDRIMATAAFFPVLAAVGWFLAVAADVLPPFFWGSAGREYFPTWMTIFVLSALISIAVIFRLKKLHEVGPVIGGMLTAAIALIYLTQLVPSYSDRHYTIRNASLDVGRLLNGTPNVLCSSAESIFLANRVSFTTGPSSVTPSHIVSAFNKIRSEQLEGYSKIQSYALYRHRDFIDFNPESASNPAISKPTVLVYQKNATR